MKNFCNIMNLGHGKQALVGGSCYNGLTVGSFASNLNELPSQSNWDIGASISKFAYLQLNKKGRKKQPLSVVIATMARLLVRLRRT